jgi:uncharacterized membrane protein
VKLDAVRDRSEVDASTELGPLHRRSRWLYGEMLIGALISLTASFVLSREALTLAADPTSVLACDISSVLSCSKVALSPQAQLFGFPNAFLGLVAEPVVITLSVAGMAGVGYPRWFMVSAQTMYLLGVVFAYWLLSESMFDIGALCPWCLTVTASTTVVFASMLRLNILQDDLFLPRPLQERALSVVRSGAFSYALAAWCIGLCAVVLAKYGPALLGS